MDSISVSLKKYIKMESKATSIDVYQIVTNRIIELLEQNIIPWRKPWISGGCPQM